MNEVLYLIGIIRRFTYWYMIGDVKIESKTILLTIISIVCTNDS